MQKLPEVGRRMREKRNRPCEKEIHSHFIGNFQIERTFFQPAASKVARLLAKSLGILMWGVSTANELTHRKKQHKNTTGHDHTKFRYINPEND